jgi:alpha-glucosidase
MRFPKTLLLTLGLLAVVGASFAAATLECTSPDSSVRLLLATDAAGHLVYSVSSRGRPRLDPSPAGVLVDNADFGAGVTLGTPQTRTIDETFAWRGNKTNAANQCRASEIPMQSKAGDWTLEVRVFNDGAAFRYRVPGAGSRRVQGESTGWQLPREATLWFQTDTANYEGVYRSARADQVPLEEDVRKQKRAVHLGPPITIAFPDGTFGLISEASLFNYSGLTLRPEGGGRFRAAFQDDPKGWSQEGPLLSPWRVIVLAGDLNALVNSDVIAALCDPPDPKLFPAGINTDWLKPGKAPCTWMVYGNDGAQWDRQKWFVDVAAATGCEYLLVDAGWRSEKWGWLKNGGDVWARAAELCRYAAERQVGIVLWHAYPEGRDDSPGLTTVAAREELFRNCQQAGVKGVKVDFFDSESKAVIQAYEDLARRAAQHRLLINFHGAHKPTGEARTWPNEITREGIREQEYVLWDVLPLAHYGALPFTRMAVGHADFLPGYVQARFLKNTTVIFQMASVVVFNSPFLCWPDNPETYLHSPLLQFVRTVPVTWDETRILPGSAIGETVLMARRKGADWYVAALNCRAEERTLEADLSGLELAGKELILYRDGATKTACQIESGLQPPTDGKLAVAVRPGGGVVAQLRPLKTFPGWR